MRLLLDTVTFLWVLADASDLSGRAREALGHPDAEVFLSPASSWEIVVKHRLGRLPLPEEPARLIPRERAARGIREAPLTEAAALRLASLPAHHRDPFDRMLICQAIEDQFVIVTPDEAIHRYPIKILW